MTRRVGGHISTAGGLQNAIANTLAIGGNCMQIFAGSPRMWARSLYPASVATGFKQAIAAQDLAPVYIHALYLTNLASDNSDLFEKSKTALIMDLKNAAAIGSAGVILHIGSHQGRGWPVTKAQVVGSIEEVLAATPKEAILLLENSAGQKGKIGSLPELHDIFAVQKDSRLRVCLDTAHAFEAGYNLATESGLEQWVGDIEKYLGWDRLDVLHLNDSKTAMGSAHDMHQNIGEGFIGADALARLINHPKLRHLPLILEVPGMDGKSGPDKENLDRVKALVK